MHHGIIKTNKSVHFSIFIILENICNSNEANEKTKATKRDFSDENAKDFQFLLENIKWDRFSPSNAPNKAQNNFFKGVFCFIQHCFHQKRN